MALPLVSPVSVVDSIADAMEEAARAAGIRHVAVARVDGLVIAHNLPSADLAKLLAAMSAAIVGTAQMAATDLRQGTFQEASVKADGGRMTCLRAGDQAIVAGLSPADANEGLVLMALRRLAARVDSAIGRLEASIRGEPEA